MLLTTGERTFTNSPITVPEDQVTYLGGCIMEPSAEKVRTVVVTSNKTNLCMSALIALMRLMPSICERLGLVPNFGRIILPGKKLQPALFESCGLGPNATLDDLERNGVLFLTEPEGSIMELSRRMTERNKGLEEHKLLIHPLELIIEECNLRNNPAVMCALDPLINNMRHGTSLMSWPEYRRLMKLKKKEHLLNATPKTMRDIATLARALFLAFPDNPKLCWDTLEEIFMVVIRGVCTIDEAFRPASIKDTLLAVPELLPGLSPQTLSIINYAFEAREREWLRIEAKTYPYYETSAPVRLRKTGRRGRYHEGHVILGVVDAPHDLMAQHARDQIRKNVQDYATDPTRGSFELFAEAPLTTVQNLGNGFYLQRSDTTPERKIDLTVFAVDQRIEEIKTRPDLAEFRDKLGELEKKLTETGCPVYGPGKRSHIHLAPNRLTVGNSYAVDGDPLPISFERIVALIWDTIENHYYVPASPVTQEVPVAGGEGQVGSSESSTHDDDTGSSATHVVH